MKKERGVGCVDVRRRKRAISRSDRGSGLPDHTGSHPFATHAPLLLCTAVVAALLAFGHCIARSALSIGGLLSVDSCSSAL